MRLADAVTNPESPRRGELCVCDLVDLLALPQPLVSRHLAYLRRTGLVEVTRESKFAHYRPR